MKITILEITTKIVEQAEGKWLQSDKLDLAEIPCSKNVVKLCLSDGVGVFFQNTCHYWPRLTAQI